MKALGPHVLQITFFLQEEHTAWSAPTAKLFAWRKLVHRFEACLLTAGEHRWSDFSYRSRRTLPDDPSGLSGCFESP